eukprot:CAMPEP_0201605824 /NCGR_PEP_ID=MMETSP0492-20130828/5506_1 /ASSEMBLY_ACC=CAM_ASM_000837 /TAXON_ID=420259 /ORGANISM="Thalassiosira gravida, Strain GMp14c1" /LENGTH=145 /DNA_ID=CAMNT_0048070143 /DNA_START=22 /DNA_END=459 /DNA_ORIENTATION=-
MNAIMHLRRLPFQRQSLRHFNRAQQQQRCMSSSGSNGVITLSDASAVQKFRTLNTKSVLYFTASWCPPCKMISPIYTKLSEKYPDVSFGKVDVDDNSDAAVEFQVSAVPTFVFCKGEEGKGDVVNKFSGADEGQLEKLIKDHQDS